MAALDGAAWMAAHVRLELRRDLLLAMITLSFMIYSDGRMPLFHLLAMITLSFYDVQRWQNAAAS